MKWEHSSSLQLNAINQGDEMLNQYIETMLWAETDDNGEPLDRNYDEYSLASETLEQCKKDCEEFQRLAGSLLDGLDLSDVGHDFWLTRNGHGAGRDRDWETILIIISV